MKQIRRSPDRPVARWMAGAMIFAMTGGGLMAMLSSLTPALAQTVPDRSSAQASYEAGLMTLRYGNFSLAAHQLEAALRQAQKQQDPELEAQLLIQLGFVYYRLHRPLKAENALRRVNQAGLKTEQRDRLLAYRGLIQIQQGRYREAWQVINRYRYRFEPQTRSPMLVAWGNLELIQGNYAGALATFERVLTLPGDRIDKADALQGLGQVYQRLDQTEQAFESYRNAHARYQALNERVGMARTQGQLGQLHQRLGQWQQAQDIYRNALAEAEALQDRLGQVRSLNRLGEIERQQQNLDAAVELHRQARLVARSLRVTPEGIRALNQLGQDYQALGQWQRALELHTQAEAEAVSIGDYLGEVESLRYQGELLLRQQKHRSAAAVLGQAVAQWESLQPGLRDLDKVSLFETQKVLYEHLQQALVASGQPEQALIAAEQGRARAFAEQLALRFSAELQPAPVPTPTLADLRQVAQQQQTTLVEYSLISQPIAPPSSSLPAQLLIWVIQPNGQINLRQTALPVDDPLLQKTVGRGRSRLGLQGNRGDRRAFDEETSPARDALPPAVAPDVTRQWHQLLIEPIADLLPQTSDSQLTFVPQGPLFLVPFAALEDAQGQALIDRHRVATTPSIQAIALTAQAAQGTKADTADRSAWPGNAALVVGNPQMPMWSPRAGAPARSLRPLPGAEQEANLVAQALQTTPLTGAAATEGQVRRRLKQAPVIHLATHGLLNESQGLQGSLALTPSDEHDGLLTAAEISQLKLRAQLVVLSACDTGRGKITGDGVLGLSRSFMTAGASSLVTSLWAVSDDSTVYLMSQFYEQLKQSPNRAEALRQAMLMTREVYPDVRDWAAFTLIGQAER